MTPSPRRIAKRLVVPLVLAVSIAGTAVLGGCKTKKSSVDAAAGDAGPDTPVI